VIVAEGAVGDEHHRADLGMLRGEDIKECPGLIVTILEPS
jgi:hypothetical protein